MCVYSKSFQTLIALVAVAIVVVTDENTRGSQIQETYIKGNNNEFPRKTELKNQELEEQALLILRVEQSEKDEFRGWKQKMSNKTRGLRVQCILTLQKPSDIKKYKVTCYLLCTFHLH